MKAAYADPPYIGMANNYPEKKEVNHAELIKSMTENYDCWALSLHTPSLPEILTYCPGGIRIGAWVKPFCSFKPGVGQAYAWEPVIFYGIRKRTRDLGTVRDWVSCNIALKKGLFGAKPQGFCFWLFEFMGLLPDDEFTDLFPGSGIVGQSWEKWKSMTTPKQLLLESMRVGNG